MKVKTPVIGGICQSTQGRDKDRYYIVKVINDDGTVGVVDGNFKKLAEPKKKNLSIYGCCPKRRKQSPLNLRTADRFSTAKCIRR